MADRRSAEPDSKSPANAEVVETDSVSVPISVLNALNDCRTGNCERLARYLRNEPPHPWVLEMIAHGLEGNAARVLRFTTRNGRPPALKGHGSEPGQEAATARALQSDPSADLLAALADALDPNGPGKWQLVSEPADHERPGNPSTELRHDLTLLYLGALALRLRPILGGYKRVAHKLGVSLRQCQYAVGHWRKPPQ